MLEPSIHPPQSWSPPESFEGYRVRRKLGEGAMGAVYLAHDTVLDRYVAVKFILTLDAETSPDAEAREQFLIEARAAARVQHPNVLTIYGVRELNDRPFIVSEFIRGQGLHTLTKPLSGSQVIKIGVDLSRGLAAAHRSGVLHRDIKPSNAIITDDGTVKLLDFGIAKIVDVAALHDEPTGAGETTPAPPPPPPADEEGGEGERAERVSGDADTLEAPTTMASAKGDGAPANAALYAEIGIADTMTAVPNADMRFPRGPVGPESVIRGTPHYMAPEIWRGERATRRSDVYSLGALLYELCTGDPPHKSAPAHDLSRVVRTRDVKPLSETAPKISYELAAVIHRCLRREASERFASGEDLSHALEKLVLAPSPHSAPEGNPYRGLLSFEAQHRSLFFGRSNEIGTLLERLRAEPFVLVAGDSGVGKSSLCRAGVIPHVLDGALGGGRAWFPILLVPGVSPLDTIASALAGVLGTDVQAVVASMKSHPAGLARDLSRALEDGRGVILFIDQLEELVTISDAAEAAIVGETLGHLTTRAPGVRLLMTARSDFLARLSSVPGIGDELTRALYLLRPMSAAQIEEVIIGPARAKRVAFESDDLVKTLVESTVDAEGSLPLLQFALAELWQARPTESSTITAEGLSAIRGVGGALARHADDVVGSLPGPTYEAARRILVSLVTLSGTRARRTAAELLGEGPHAASALEKLVAGKLLVLRDTTSGIAYELAHEALLKGWGTLRMWLDDQAESRAVKQRLEAAATEWDRFGRKSEALWSARQLSEAKPINPSELAPREAAFLATSRRVLRRGRTARYTALIGGPALLLLILYGSFKIQAWRAQAEEQRARAERVDRFVARAKADMDEARSLAAELIGVRRQAFAAFDGQRVSEGDVQWAKALEQSTRIDRAWEGASQALEAALTVDAGRTDVRDQLGDVLYERALAAGGGNNEEQRNELLKRLALYDKSGERQRRFHAPGRLTIESRPPSAAVTLERFTKDASRKLRLTAAKSLGSTPITDTGPIEPGSYLLTFTAPDRAVVRYPLLLERGESMRISLDLPLSSEVPKGFVYIPPGRFLFGTSMKEAFRMGFLGTVPAHEITTGAYFIAKNETTFEDWIEYLKALPTGERAPRTPKVGRGRMAGKPALEELRGGEWQLTLQPGAGEPYVVRQGTRISYAVRTSNTSQDWLKFPVSGVAVSAILDYARWLDGSGKVPGARLCTEIEWERAARGADAREFAMGDWLDSADANFDKTYGGEQAGMGPDEVGLHPASRSPFGLDDMVGNVFEWTVSSLEPNQYLVRGGSYWYGTFTNMSTNRGPYDPDVIDPNLGIRICAARRER